MTQQPAPSGNSTPPSNRRLWLMILTRTSLVFVVALLAGLGAGAWWLWGFIHNQLAPQIAKELSKSLDRPVEVGKIEKVSWTGVRVGPSALPPTEKDPDKATIAAIEVGFNPLQILQTHQVDLTLNLIQPKLYIEQDQQGVWIEIPKVPEQPPQPVQVVIRTVQVKDGEIALSPAPRPGSQRSIVTFNQLNGRGLVSGRDEQEKIALDISMRTGKGGGLSVQGEVRPEQPTANLQVRLQNLSLVELGQLAQKPPRLSTQAGDKVDFLPATVESGQADGSFAVQIKGTELPNLVGTIGFQNVSVVATGIPEKLTSASGRLRLQGQQVRLEGVSAKVADIPLKVGGQINAQVLDPSTTPTAEEKAAFYNLKGEVGEVELADLVARFKVETPIALAGRVKSDFQVTGAPELPIVTGKLRSTSDLTVDKLKVTSLQAGFKLENQILAIDDLLASLGIGGELSGNGRLALGENGGLQANFQINDVQADQVVQLYGGKLGPDLTIGKISAKGEVSGALNNLQAVVDWQAPEATYPGSGQILWAGGDNLSLRNTLLKVEGGILQAEGQVANGQWQAIVTTDAIQLSRFSKDLRGTASGRINLSGSLASFDPAAIRATGDAVLSRGLATVEQPLAASFGQPLTTRFEWDGKQLLVQEAESVGFTASGSITPDLQGTPSIANVDLAFRLRNFDLGTVPIPPAQANNVALAGRADFAGRLTGNLDSLNLDGELSLDRVALNQSREGTLAKFDRASFSGKVTGSLTKPTVLGAVTVSGLAARDFMFKSTLRGDLNYALGEGGKLNLAGNGERIDVSLGADNRLQAFFLKQDEAIAEGKLQGDQLTLMVKDFPIASFRITPLAGLDRVGGRFNGTIVADIAKQSAVGTIAIADPTLGHLGAQDFKGQVSFANGVATLTNGEFLLGNSRYLLNGQFIPGLDPQFQGSLKIDKGNLSDIFKTLEWFEVFDLARGFQPPTYSNADGIAVLPVGDPTASVLQQLKRLAEIEGLLAQQRADRRANPLPDLRQVKGTFTGEINVSKAPKEPISMDFNLQGKNWRLEANESKQTLQANGNGTNGNVLKPDTDNPDVPVDDEAKVVKPLYLAEEVIIKGDLKKGVLTFQPISFRTGDAFLSYAGPLSTDSLGGQLEFANIAVDSLPDFISLPVPVFGNLEGLVSFGGAPRAPRIIGQVALKDGTINGTPMDSAQGNFNYGQRQLAFSSQLVIDGPPLKLSGKVPAPLAIDESPKRPDEDQIELNVDLENEGLALMNVFSREVTWVEGKGAISLRVRGTRQDPQAQGTLSLDKARFKVLALPEPITDVTGTANFQGDRIVVESITGKFSKGDIQVIGFLPLTPPSTPTNPDAVNEGETPTPANTPLTASFKDLSLNLIGIYRGGAEGSVNISGGALAPLVGGQITLVKGQVFLPDTEALADRVPAEPDLEDQDQFFQPPELKDLNITLGNGVFIVSPPVLQFLASGNLVVNGTINDPQPDGTIRLASGQINIGTSVLNLATGAANTATFSPSQRLDPILSVRLVALAQEVSRKPIVAPASSGFAVSERPDAPATNLGALRTVRIEARVNAPASQLKERLELTSSPPRSETEIIALLGGGFLSSLEQGDTSLALANIASSALLSQVQGLIGNTIGLTDFRLFPTVISTGNRVEDAGQANRSTLGFAAEIGTDITDRLSVSLLRILNADLPTQYNLRYQFNDQILFRGSTDFSGDSRAAVEYELRF